MDSNPDNLEKPRFEVVHKPEEGEIPYLTVASDTRHKAVGNAVRLNRRHSGTFTVELETVGGE